MGRDSLFMQQSLVLTTSLAQIHTRTLISGSQVGTKSSQSGRINNLVAIRQGLGSPSSPPLIPDQDPSYYLLRLQLEKVERWFDLRAFCMRIRPLPLVPIFCSLLIVLITSAQSAESRTGQQQKASFFYEMNAAQYMNKHADGKQCKSPMYNEDFEKAAKAVSPVQGVTGSSSQADGHTP